MDELKISVNMDKLTLGDMEALESGVWSKILGVFDHIIEVDDIPPEGQKEALRALPWTSLAEITERIKTAIDTQVNPEVGGKN